MKPARTVRFKARLKRPDTGGKTDWTFLVLPKAASANLPTRNAITVQGTINGRPFRAKLEPDGQRSHWLKVTRKLGASAGVRAGDDVSLEIAPSAVELESRAPTDLRRALAADPKAKALWDNITPVARRDWIAWVVSAKQAETRARRVANACQMLAGGKRRVCCFDRSGYYSKGFGAPKAKTKRGRSHS